MTVICGISTSSSVASVALLDGDTLLATAQNREQKLHAERLFALVDECLSIAKVDRDALETIACDIGPGSFTGVRVGVAAATGIALGLASVRASGPIRCVGVHALAALSARAPRADAVTLTAVDGQKGQVFFVISRPGAAARFEVHVEDAPRYLEIARDAVAAGGVLVGDFHVALGFSPDTFVRGAVDAELVCRFATRAQGTPSGSCFEDGFVAALDPSASLVPIYGRGADATPLSDRGARPAT